MTERKINECFHKASWFNHACALISEIVARVSGLRSKHLFMRSIARSDILQTFSEMNRWPSTASRAVGNGETPANKYESNTPSVQTSAGAAW